MAKFGDQFYRDFFGFNQKLMEEDWNDDQKYVFKLKQKGEETVSSILLCCLTNIMYFTGIRSYRQGRRDQVRCLEGFNGDED